jgi:anti-sigma B factor antagonist
MIVEKRQSEGHTLLNVEGVIRLGESAAFFAQTLERVLEGEEGHVIIDFSKINYIDSTGIGELVGYMVRLQEQKRKLILIHPPERIRKLLEVANVLELFDLHDSVEAALAAETAG